MTYRFLSLLLTVLLCSVSCTDTLEKKQEEESVDLDWKNVELTISLQENSPFENAIKNGINDFQSLTGAKVQLKIEAKDQTEESDLIIVSGDRLYRTFDRLAKLDDDVLEDRKLELLAFSTNWRFIFNKDIDSYKAIPLSGDSTVLWYRKDLFENAENKEKFQTQFNRTLTPPSTWEEYRQIAQFFHEQNCVSYGCVEPMDQSIDTARHFLMRCGSIVHEPHSKSFVLDTQTGRSVMQRPGYKIALENYVQCMQYSPASKKDSMSIQEAREVFLDGESAMLLDRVPPTIFRSRDKLGTIGQKIESCRLPGWKSYAKYDNDSKQWIEDPQESVQYYDYYASTGWFIGLSTKAVDSEYAKQLLLFFTREESNHFLVQACRDGMIPIMPNRMLLPDRYTGYRLPVNKISNYLILVRNSYDNDNWNADLRFNNNDQITKTISKMTMSAGAGTIDVDSAIDSMHQKIEQALEQDSRLESVNQFRNSQGLPQLSNLHDPKS